MSSASDGPPGPASAGPPPAGSPARGSTARPAALLAVRITSDDVGSRVTVRHRLHDDPTASLTDVVGVLRSWEPGPDGGDVLRIERRDSSVATVRLDDVVAAKRVPPAPPRRAR
ncbi:MAG TPA: hypothetical protein VFL59_01050 [Candidatus Nanopelagicales bacterium]|nr:hypothetical protein [Candidatus Nanopelagicales bacterium]